MVVVLWLDPIARLLISRCKSTEAVRIGNRHRRPQSSLRDISQILRNVVVRPVDEVGAPVAAEVNSEVQTTIGTWPCDLILIVLK